jgi:hypothetical protein
MCGLSYAGSHRQHLDAAGHVRSRSRRATPTGFVSAVRAHPDLRITDVGADFGLRREAAQRAVAKAGLFRRGRRRASLVRDALIVRRSREGVSRRELASEFGLSLSHVYYVLRVARARGTQSDVDRSTTY